ncbi:hypothetical protein FQA39_LY01727 [Lamprigera yunnana]|nr:hypothetical protein FQA39_LY01727 [Lamprigera yunnana]
MDGILALCHFCETHGPCVILCTQRSKEQLLQAPHSLTIPWCEACQSIDLSQALLSRDTKTSYITTRTPQQQDLSFLLKQAAVRSLSCEEETSKDGGTLYFGDNERGHIISHTFILRDSLARGFHRKYSILMLMRDKIHLLNSWPVLVKHMQELVKELQTQADAVNNAEQTQRSQRAVRQAEGTPKSNARSLSQLTGQPAIFGHIHLWFTWMLNCETVVEKPSLCLPLPELQSPLALRNIALTWDNTVFHTVCFCTVIGTQVVTDDPEITAAFQVLLPSKWSPLSNTYCFLKKNTEWTVEWLGVLPQRLPTLITVVEKALRNEHLPDAALTPYINGVVLKWLHIVQSLHWSKGKNNSQLVQSLGVQNHDMPLVNYWMFRLSQT